MTIEHSYFKKYNFINFVERWDDDWHHKYGSGLSPIPGLRKLPEQVHYSKATWNCHVMTNGTKNVKVHYTAKKSTDFRALMNMTLAEAGRDGWWSKVNCCALYNRVDEQFGTCIAAHGDQTMGDLFEFNGSDYTVTYRFNYNLWDRIDRLKTIGLLNDDLSMDNPFNEVLHSFPTELQMQGDPDGRDICMNFVGDVTNPSQMVEWNSKAYLIPDETTALTIPKRGQADTLVMTNVFTVGDTNIPLEVGRPIRLASLSVDINQGVRGLIFHVWK